jgi:hypothetical protein
MKLKNIKFKSLIFLGVLRDEMFFKYQDIITGKCAKNMKAMVFGSS